MNDDKILHFLTGGFLSVIVMVFSGSAFLAIAAAIVAGVAKEIYDDNHPGHTSDIFDALATITGGIVFLLVYLFVLSLF